MLGELISELASLVGRIFIFVVVDVIFELLLKGAGYLLLRPFTRSIDPDGVPVIAVGIIFWLLVVPVAFSLASQA